MTGLSLRLWHDGRLVPAEGGGALAERGRGAVSCSAVQCFLVICDLLRIHPTDHNANSTIGLAFDGQVKTTESPLTLESTPTLTLC